LGEKERGEPMLRAPKRRPQTGAVTDLLPSYKSILEPSLQALFRTTPNAISFEQLYSCVYKHVNAHLSPKLHQHIKTLIENHILENTPKSEQALVCFAKEVAMKTAIIQDVTMYMWKNYMEAARLENFAAESEKMIKIHLLLPRRKEVGNSPRHGG
jgi:hypothetical protein